MVKETHDTFYEISRLVPFEFDAELRKILEPEEVDSYARGNQELSGVDRTKSAKYGFKS